MDNETKKMFEMLINRLDIISESQKSMDERQRTMGERQNSMDERQNSMIETQNSMIETQKNMEVRQDEIYSVVKAIEHNNCQLYIVNC